jgi:hypothetical protein
MRAWDLEDCEAAIGQLKDSVAHLESLVYELQSLVEELADEEE